MTTDIRHLYDREMRADPPPEKGVRHVWADGVLRTLGEANWIGWWQIAPEAVTTTVAREAAYFAALSQTVEWKVFSHDGPTGLEIGLSAAGFLAEPCETFMVCDQRRLDLSITASDDIEVRRVKDDAGIADLITVDRLAFDRTEPRKFEALRASVLDGSVAVYVAYVGGVPASAARLEFAPGRQFAGLHGGGTLPGYRGRGLYRALIAARATEARRLGISYLTVDARETSRPILERLGFQALSTVRGWVSPAAP